VFPVRDENPTLHRPLAVWGIVAVNIYVWFAIEGFGTDPALTTSVCELGLIPARLLGAVTVSAPPCHAVAGGGGVYTFVTSMFLHASLFHIVGNMWFLWIFGDNVEDAMGPLRFALFYLLCGLAAALAQVVSAPASPVPMVGASGAIGGVMGAYARYYPRAHVHMLVVLFPFVTTAAVPAVLILGYWFLLQVLGGLPQLGGAQAGVAFWAHVGGFVTGLSLAMPMADPRRLEAHRNLTARLAARYRV